MTWSIFAFTKERFLNQKKLHFLTKIVSFDEGLEDIERRRSYNHGPGKHNNLCGQLRIHAERRFSANQAPSSTGCRGFDYPVEASVQPRIQRGLTHSRRS